MREIQNSESLSDGHTLLWMVW